MTTRLNIPLLSLLASPMLVAGPVSYSRQVRPLLAENCFYCHGQDKNHRKADLRLDTREGQRQEKIIIPGQAEASELVKRLFSTDPEETMPPPDSHRHLNPEQRELLKRWVSEGAVYEDHWTFIAPKRPETPQVAGFAIANPIDGFVAAKLAEAGLPFSPEADRTTLIRRLSFDLTGLPPSPEEVAAFTADQAPDAYAKLVEKLLASEHFGERMAIPWLDAARFADSNGFQQEGDTHQYFWRDWVVRAYNADMPFDQFSIEQLAGDLLPEPTEDQLIATAFNRNHLLNGEGGAIAEEQRNVILFDRVDTTSTNWLGLTMACAQCHDHKYDPMTMKDYYSLMAYFNNVPETGVPPFGGQYRIADPWIPIGSPEEKAKIKTMDETLAKAKKEEQEITKSKETEAAYVQTEQDLGSQAPAEWTVLKTEKMEATGGAKMSILDDDSSIYVDGPSPDKGDYTISLAASSTEITGFRIEAIPDRRLPGKGAGRGDSGNAVLTKLSVSPTKLNAASATYTQGGFAASGVLDDDVNTAWAFYPDVTRLHILTVDCQDPIPAGTPVVMKFEFQSPHKQHLLGRFRISATKSPRPASRTTLPDEIIAILKTPNRDAAAAKKLREFVAKTYPPAPLAKAQAAAKAADDAVKKFRQDLPRVMVMSDKQPRKTKILDRGNYLTPKEEVPAGSPGFLPAMPADFPKNRLGFAKWLFLPEHPLTARVQANRLWQYFFGVGLVKTAEDLGVQSEVPLHYELLDWLAVEFREKGWSQKHLIRLILNSTTYRQSSKVDATLWQRDPENRLMARGSRFRLPSMILRDVALAASGLLNPKMFGKPVYPYQPGDVWENLAITKERDFTYPASKGPDLYRRSLYTFWRRTIGPTNMFDASARQSCKVRSAQTSTPLHALTTLNDPTWVEASRMLAEKALKAETELPKQIDWAFRRILARATTPADMQVLQRAYDKQRQIYLANPTAAEEFLGVGESPRDKKLPAVEHAALTALCLAIFNLDEALVRP